jgi:hypothetical protein
MSVINKERFQAAMEILQEDRLSIVCVPGTNINHPCHPEALVVSDPDQAGPGENLEQPFASST